MGRTTPGMGLGDVITRCSSCDRELPVVRAPDSLQQAMWGGWTCPGCGERLDARGWPLAPVVNGPNGAHHRFGAPPSGAVGLALTLSVFGSIGLFALGSLTMLVGAVIFPPLVCAIPLGLIVLLLVLAGVSVGSVLLSRRGERVRIGPDAACVGERSIPWTEVQSVDVEGARAVLVLASGRVLLPSGSAPLREALDTARSGPSPGP